MPLSIDNYLRSLSLDYYLKNSSSETIAINTSLTSLALNIDKQFGPLIKRHFVFGSYDRDTILPRKFDSKSDIDVMVVFNHTDYERTPETYRTWLKNFADKYYTNRYGSEVIKSFPTVTVRLNHIHYDLVPAKEEVSLYRTTLSIPGDLGWQTTEPNDIREKLIAANTKYNNIIRHIIRILKAWNSSNDYPCNSYQLELQIISMTFYNHNVQSGLFYAVDQLTILRTDSQSKMAKLRSLKYNIKLVQNSLNQNDVENAKRWLHQILPMP